VSVSREYTVLLAFIALCITFSGCSLLKVHEQSEFIENIGRIKGSVTVTGTQKGEVIVLRYRDENGTPVLKAQTALSEKGEYQFNVAPGKHYLAAFVDVNNDGQYQENEHGNFWGNPSFVLVPKKETVNLKPIIISGLVPKPENGQKARKSILKIVENIGRVTSIIDPTFTRKNYSMGMWHPVDFLEQVGGGLFFLQPYQPEKIPILFIHGVNGGPTDWKTLIANLDDDKFQPWVLFYPSGLRLDMISDYLMQAVVSLQKEYHFKRFSIVSHSMGGLVSRSFIKKCTEKHPKIANKINFAMTINSPLGGMASAAAGAKHSPIVIPSWKDVAPDSVFLKDISDWTWPEDIPYYLVFSYKTGGSGDGVVSLKSQIPPKFQAESLHMYGFNNNHVGTLEDPYFLTLFNNLLNHSLRIKPLKDDRTDTHP